jgi:hypothetical protein
MRPRLVLFGDSITEQSFAPGGWGAALADHFARQVRPHLSPSLVAPPLAAAYTSDFRRLGGCGAARPQRVQHAVGAEGSG